MIALGTELARRGHAVTLQTWSRWREPVEAAGMDFVAAPEYDVFPTRGRPLKPYEAVVRAARETVPVVEATRPEVVVADILTLAPGLAGEICGVPVATLIPHVQPSSPEGFPPYSLGARLPRTPLGRAGWRAISGIIDRGLRLGRDELNESRRRLGLAPLQRYHGGQSSELVLVATLPQLEYPREWMAHEHVVGPLLWEPPFGAVSLPPGDAPLVLVAPSTSQDLDHRLLKAALAGLGDLPIRVIATWNRRPLNEEIAVPANTRLVEWLSYAKTMALCDAVVCHAGHGTVVRALASGCAVVAVPAAGDMNENAARVDWAGVGVRVPRRFTTASALRLAVARALWDHRIHERVEELARWSSNHDGPARAADLVEQLAAR